MIERQTNFFDNNGVDLGKKLVTKEYILNVYPSIAENALGLTSELWIWGNSTQLDANFRQTPTPFQYSGIGWRQVSASSGHVAAIKTDGTLWTWGNGFGGKLGTNNTLNRSTPVTTFAGGNNWKQVSTGDRSTYAIKTNGTLWTWGYNSSGQLGINNTLNRSTPVTTFAGGIDWKQVSGATSGAAAIKTNGTLWTWGYSAIAGTNLSTNRLTPGTTFIGGNNWKKVSAGSHCVGLKTDGTLWVWGAYPLGHTTTIRQFTPVTIFLGGANWTDTATGLAEELFTINASKHASFNNQPFGFGIRGGALYGWGWNYLANLGNNNTNNRSTPVTTFVGGTNWRQVECGAEHTVATRTNGTLWCWGSSTNGQVGANFSGVYFLTPVTTFTGGTNWRQASAGRLHTAATKTDGTLWTWGYNSDGQLGNNAILDRSRPVTTFAGGTNWKQVSCGGNFIYSCTAAVKTDGTLWTWGYNNSGQLGTNNTNSSLTPVTTFTGGTNWSQISLGSRGNSAAIKTDGTLWVWGDNQFGQLGTNNFSSSLSPVTTFAGGNNWKQVSCGYQHTAAVKTDGSLWTWGYGKLGELGTNDTNDRITPVTTFVGGTDWSQVSAGLKMTYALKGSGVTKELYVFGNAGKGALGTNFSETSFNFPIQIDGNDWRDISHADGLLMSIKTDGTLWQSTSRNNYPNTFVNYNNNSVFTESVTPVPVPGGGTNWKQISVGDDSVTAIKTDGTLWTWGYNPFSGTTGVASLGIEDFVNRSTPVTTIVGGNDWKQVSSSLNYSIAIRTQDII